MTVINLNQARKARDKAKAKTDAAANRAKHGRTKGDKALTKAEADKASRDLDGAKRED